MAKKFLIAIDLSKNELQNPQMHNLASAPGSPVKGQMYMNTTDNIMYWWNGSAWIAAQSGASLAPATTVTTQAIGDSPVVGGATPYSREDHKHGMPAFGNVSTETSFGQPSSNGGAATVPRSDHVHGTPAHSNAEHATVPISSLNVPSSAVNFNGQRIFNLGTPTAGTDAVTKDYADNLQAGLSWKDSVRVATTVNVTLAGALVIDGVAVTFTDRVLVKNQSAPAQNGIYTPQAGAWIRTLDANTAAEVLQATVFVEEGTQADTAWTMTTNAPITLDTTALTWVQFGAGTSYTGGGGLTLTGSTFAVGAGSGITVNADDVAVTWGGNGSGVTASRSDHNHDASYSPTAHNHDASYTKKFAANLAAAASQAVTHNLNTRDVSVDVYRNGTPWDTVECDVERTDANNVTLRFSIAPAANEYRAVVVG